MNTWAHKEAPLDPQDPQNEHKNIMRLSEAQQGTQRTECTQINTAWSSDAHQGTQVTVNTRTQGGSRKARRGTQKSQCIRRPTHRNMHEHGGPTVNKRALSEALEAPAGKSAIEAGQKPRTQLVHRKFANVKQGPSAPSLQ